jgi:Tol biopolymer transport system component
MKSLIQSDETLLPTSPPTAAGTVILLFLCLLGGTGLWHAAAQVSAESLRKLEATSEEKIVISIANDAAGSDYTLYTVNPDGSGQAQLFDFHSHPQDVTGGIWQPRISPDGAHIYFSSDNAYLFTPAARNLFRITSDGSTWNQITPDVNSGKWNQPGPYGVVQGTVRQSNGDPWTSAPIYLEGMDLKYSEADGSFRFENVPEGRRWIVACKPGDCDTFDAEEILVSSAAAWTADLVPGTDGWMEFQRPVVYGERIYHTLGINQIQWTDVNASAYNNVYTVGGTCAVPDVDGFDVGVVTGKLAIMDYGNGCPTNRGLYIADKDGNNPQLLVDMKATGAQWCGAQELFWSPDESRVAFKACYDFGAGWQTHLYIYDATTGGFLGGVTFPDTSYTLYNVALHGWNPDGTWLLYSYWLDPTQANLDKVRVNADGSVDTNSFTTVLSNLHLGGATWGNLTTTAPCTALSGVAISGPTNGSPGTQYTFTADVQPTDASTPSYSWSTDGLISGQGSARATYAWSTNGTKSVSVQASNCGGTQDDQHTVIIGSVHQIYLPLAGRGF